MDGMNSLALTKKYAAKQHIITSDNILNTQQWTP